MDLTTLVTFAVALGIAAAIPGPGVAALVGRSLATGFRPTLPMVLGLIAGDLTYLTVAVLGLAFIAESLGTFFFVVKWAGIAYLLYLAWKFWTAQSDKLIANNNAKTATPFQTFLAGLAVTLGNPKTITFYLALTPTIVDVTHLTLISYLELVGIVFVVLGVVITPYVALAARARTTFEKPAALKRLNRTAATLLAGAAAGLAFKS
ncbi:MAG: LysE family translocator [Hyphomicrobiales bacterium]